MKRTPLRKRSKKPHKIKESHLDKLWSELVRKKAGNMCEYCHKKEFLNAHHIFSRSSRSVRWEPQNGICLCSGHHTFSSAFSAHKTPMEFSDWIKDYKGEDWYNKLRLQAHALYKPDYQAVKERLEAELATLNPHN